LRLAVADLMRKHDTKKDALVFIFHSLKWVRLVKTFWALLSCLTNSLPIPFRLALTSLTEPKVLLKPSSNTPIFYYRTGALQLVFLNLIQPFHIAKVMVSKSLFHEILMSAEGLRSIFQVNT
jgi:hypothetical protein